MICSYHPLYGALRDGVPATSKHALLRELLLGEGILTPGDLVEPEPLDLETAALVHERAYLDLLERGTLPAAAQRRLGLAWSETLWRRVRLACAGTVLAARAALERGLAGNLAGGGHHAFADHGEGFCVLNDVAIAVARLRAERAVERAVIIDLDVHQGNGTAAIFERVPEVFTFSIHGERNYPSRKMRSTRDVALPDGAGDSSYLDILQRELPTVLERSCADIAFYLAGVDVARGDRFGKLALTEDGIRRRDRRVIESVRERGIPLVIVLAGGYAETLERTAELHAHAFREAVAYERGGGAAAARRLRPPPSSPSAC